MGVTLVALGLVVASVIVILLIRSVFLFYGLTPDEQKAEWPGDHEVAGAKPGGSRAITIQATATSVWPWLTQIGQDRAGFYSYRWLENLVGAEMPDIRTIRPEWSTRSVGDRLIMAPVQKFGAIATMEIFDVKPGEYYIAKNAEGTWGFFVRPIDSSRCRLVARGTWAPPKNLVARLFHAVIFDPIHFMMEWKMLRQIRRLAEGRQ